MNECMIFMTTYKTYNNSCVWLEKRVINETKFYYYFYYIFILLMLFIGSEPERPLEPFIYKKTEFQISKSESWA
jgi:hypothetical protein